MKKNNILRSAIKVSSVVLVNILIVLTVLYIIHLYYLKTIQKPNQRASFESLTIPHISKETLMKLGSFSNNYKNSSFVHFKKEKPSRDIIRIGCFGDSHTYCDEVNEKNDFPRKFLQEPI